MEAVGAASGVIAIASIAIQLAETIKELVEFGKAVQDAPADICALFQDLEVLRSALLQIHQTSNRIGIDAVTETVLKECERKIYNLKAELQPSISNLKSNKLACRKWSAFKITLKKGKIESLQKAIEYAKSTLILIQNNNLSELFISAVQAQSKVVLHNESFGSLIQNVRTERTDPKHSTTHVHPLRERCNDACTPNHQADFTKRTACSLERADCLSWEPRPSTSSQGFASTRHRSFDFQTRKRESSQTQKYNTVIPFVSILAQSRTYVVSTVRSSEVCETSESRVSLVVYPNAGGKFLGMSRGVLLSATSSSGWQYTIQPFRAVAENSLIFEFCRKGNLEGVRTLFERREASPWDRDPTGQTPLWIATKALQLDVAKLLLNEGADPHAITWESESEPIWAITSSEIMEIDPKLAMIHLLQRHRREDYEDDTMMHIIGLSMLGYRPQKSFNMPWSKRCEALLKLLSTLMPILRSEDPYRAKIIWTAIHFYYEQEALRWLLRTTRCSLDGSVDHSIIHEALHQRLLERDLCSMRLIVQKTKNLHFCAKKGYALTGFQTPTMLAMYDMNMFQLWRQILCELGHDIERFIHDELEEGLLRQEGWTEASMKFLFHLDIPSDSHPAPFELRFPSCQRCGRNNTVLGAKLMVDLEWRRRLRDIRLRYSDGLPMSLTGNQPETPVSDGPLPYKTACSHGCLDRVCVAFIYDDDSVNEPKFPLYHDLDSTEWEAGSESNGRGVALQETCPTNKMPGAFRD